MVGSEFFDRTNNGVCSDGFMENLKFFDFPMESLEGDGLDEGDWDAKLQGLGPIPSESLMASLLTSGGDIGNAGSVVTPNLSVASEHSSELKLLPNLVEAASGASNPLQNDHSDRLEPAMFEVPSPVSVLESSSSCSVEKNVSFSFKPYIPALHRTKRSRSSTINPWVVMTPPISSTSKRSHHLLAQSNDFPESNLPNMNSNPVKRKLKKKKKLSQLSRANEIDGTSSQRPIATKRCTHCDVSKTPQWREGPMGPKTLCNACGVRYRSGRLFPQYRPALSPTFVPSLHSNSHKKVVEMRNKAIQEAAKAEAEPPMSPPHKPNKKAAIAETEPPLSPFKATQEAAIAETEPPLSPPPEFVPMSSYLFDFDCILGVEGNTPRMGGFI
ncbi:GATA transcription factor 11 [Camellia lanceoleosa]|uniref:GATA transcription factor 11 n=1 Tax=Camellia lanceoleosa TaxID=1840588 RepID=A0ACC0F7M4_9ERIC|nr:GATA transcription factor 11 [Camellia lanceoleosa]